MPLPLRCRSASRAPAASCDLGFGEWTGPIVYRGINDAGAFLCRRLDETPVEDMRLLFEVSFWGLVYGSLEAVGRLRERGGTLINVGSVLSDRAVPLQGTYSASQHAVKGFTDALRMEGGDEGAPVSVTLIKPSAIDTASPTHAKSYMDRGATVPPPASERRSLVGLYGVGCVQEPVRESASELPTISGCPSTGEGAAGQVPSARSDRSGVEAAHLVGGPGPVVGLLTSGALRLGYSLAGDEAAVAALVTKHADVPVDLADARVRPPRGLAA